MFLLILVNSFAEFGEYKRDLDIDLQAMRVGGKRQLFARANFCVHATYESYMASSVPLVSGDYA